MSVFGFHAGPVCRFRGNAAGGLAGADKGGWHEVRLVDISLPQQKRMIERIVCGMKRRTQR